MNDERYAAPQSFQSRVKPWLDACFGPEIAGDKIERNHRFLEEALEAVQSAGCTQSEAHQLVDYVFGRPSGDLMQEVGGVMNTLAALCLAHGIDMAAAGETELARVWTKVKAIRAKQAAKPKHGPLPGPSDAAPAPQGDGWRPIESAPKDQLIEVYAPSREGLNPIVSLCEWHPDAGFCICEIRYPTHWRAHNPPAPPSDRAPQGGER